MNNISVLPISNNTSFRGKLLRTKALEKYVDQMSLVEFDRFTKNVEKMEKVNDGNKFAFLMKRIREVDSSGIHSLGIIKDVGDNSNFKNRIVVETEALKNKNTPPIYCKENVDDAFEDLWYFCYNIPYTICKYLEKKQHFMDKQGPLLMTAVLEKYINLMGSTKFFEFEDKINKIASTNDGKKYIFDSEVDYVNNKYSYILKDSVTNEIIESREISKLEYDTNLNFQTIEEMFGKLWDKYPESEESIKDLEIRKKLFLKNLEEYTNEKNNSTQNDITTHNTTTQINILTDNVTTQTDDKIADIMSGCLDYLSKMKITSHKVYKAGHALNLEDSLSYIKENCDINTKSEKFKNDYLRCVLSLYDNGFYNISRNLLDNISFDSLDNIIAILSNTAIKQNNYNVVRKNKPLIMAIPDIIKTKENSAQYYTMLDILKNINIDYNIKDQFGISFLEKVLNSENTDLLELIKDKNLDYYPELDYAYNNIYDTDFKNKAKEIKLNFENVKKAINMNFPNDEMDSQIKSPFFQNAENLKDIARMLAKTKPTYREYFCLKYKNCLPDYFKPMVELLTDSK